MSDPKLTDDENQAVVDAVAETTPGRRRRRRASASELSVNMDELRELIQLIRENDFTEFELEREGYRVRFRRGLETGAQAGRSDATNSTQTTTLSTSTSTGAEAHGSTPAPAHPGAKAQTAASEDQDLYIIPSPIVGTFYRSPSPNADSFVKIGSSVESDTVVCIIEAMKLMNEIQAETTGEVAKIYVENGQPVEYGQPLFGIKK
ncbi:MAG TPA: acetyl-CoA carboxylase biotin carboxyl carrier protein [Pyrinomonadaceae bacterium]|jgi:acetyl-CoA carboxylase biotin carboxyl carrier protein|nr:acetyl-CoA carboxylase biotin carboxyl carrier protein [Pyrinomonadaceae bacterium]